VVHLAGRAHILRETAANPEAEFLRVNAEGTAALVRSAASAGVRRVIYMSSAGVLGSSSGDAPFTAVSPPRPHNAYARSKLAGELAARAAAGARLELIVLRVPLVYGPGVRANFLRLLRWVDRGWPLPLGAVHNRRSLLSVWNLCDLLVHIVLNPAASSGTWLVSDGEDLSTPELVCRIGAAMGRRVRLLPVPVGVLQLFGRLMGRQALITQLCGSLSLDIAPTREQLSWSPPMSVDESLARSVNWFLAESRSPRI
jgi:UDP-glucose 4-epimerase